MKTIPNLWLVVLFLSIAVNMSGCSDGRLKTEPVTGVITLDGEPLEGAAVNFSPKEPGQGAIGFARTNEKGEYRLQTMLGNPDAGTLPGEYAVTISKYILVPTGAKVRNQCPFTGEVSVDDEMTSALLFPGMRTYASAETTPFSATVVKGRNRFDFELKSR